jgi:hypothetical protein
VKGSRQTFRLASMAVSANYSAGLVWATTMYLGFPAPPFTRENLTRHFGFPVPPPFVTFLNALCEDCASGEAVYNRVVDSLEWLLVSEYGDYRYQQTPPELFPIAMTGVDGGHFGYVIHAPELALSDYPIARFEPMDSNGAYLLGASTFEAVETEISANMRYAQEDDWQSSPASFDWWPEVSARLARLGIVPDPSKAGRNYDDGHGKPVMPTVPEGWRYVPSSDGAGVLAPAAQFHPTFPHCLADRPNPTLVLDTALRHAAEHFRATALWLLRECYWRTWPLKTEDNIGLCRAMGDAYASLGRASLAAVVERRIVT